MDKPFMILSNQVDSLFDELINRLYHPNASFRKIIVVPSKVVHDQLTKKLMSSSIKIAMGYKVLTLQQSFLYLFSLQDQTFRSSDELPSTSKLRLLLWRVIEDLLASMHAKTEDSTLILDLWYYLKNDQDTLDIYKLQGLCETLASEFSKIRLYGSLALDDFLKKPSWQALIWEKIFKYHLNLTAVVQKLAPLPLKVGLDLHLFLLPNLPKIYQEFFSLLAQKHAVIDYIWTPTRVFIGDLLSDKKRLFYEQQVLKEGVKVEEVAMLHEYLSERHPLLANFSEVLKTRLHVLETSATPQLELFTENEEESLSTLKTIQEGLLEDSLLLEQDAVDSSIELHSFPSHLREVEGVKHTIMRLMYEKSYLPSDFLVLVTDLSTYAPFIRHVFEDKESPLPIKMYPLEILSQSQFLQCFWKICCLASSDFKVEDVLEIFHFEPFKKKWNFTDEDLAKIKAWCEEASIYSGIEAHASLNIERMHTWTLGIRRMVMGTAIFDQEASLLPEYDYYPIDIVEGSDLKLFEKLLIILKTLQESLPFLKEGSRTLSEWLTFFTHMIESLVDHTTDAGYGYLQQQLKGYLDTNEDLQTHSFPFIVMAKILEEICFAKSGSYGSGGLGSVIFTAFNMESVTASKVLIVMGVDELSLPKKDTPFCLCKLSAAKMDKIPTPILADREAILRAIGMTKDALLFSYTDISKEDGKELSVSFLIEEIDAFIKTKLCQEGLKRIRHASYSFHEMYFAGNRLQSFSSRDYQIAKKSQEAIVSPHHFFKGFYQDVHLDRQPLPLSKKETISLYDLKELSQHPVRYYLKKTLGMKLSLDEDQKELQSKLPSWKREMMAKAVLKKGSYDDFRKAYLLGDLPEGVFGDIELARLEQEVEIIHSLFNQREIRPKTLFSIRLTSSCMQPTWLDAHTLIMPALSFKLHSDVEVIIDGVFEDISESGMIVVDKGDFSSLLKYWAIYLVFTQLNIPDKVISKSLVFLENGKMIQVSNEEALFHLKAILNYYFKAKESPSPLMPKWTEHFLKDSDEALAHAVAKDFSGDYQDATMKWFQDHYGVFTAPSLYKNWSSTAQELYSTLSSKLTGDEE